MTRAADGRAKAVLCGIADERRGSGPRRTVSPVAIVDSEPSGEPTAPQYEQKLRLSDERRPQFWHSILRILPESCCGAGDGFVNRHARGWKNDESMILASVAAQGDQRIDTARAAGRCERRGNSDDKEDD